MVDGLDCRRANSHPAMPRVAAGFADQVSLLIERPGLKLVADAQGVVPWDVLAPHVDGLTSLKAERCTQLLDAPEQFDGLGFCQHD